MKIKILTLLLCSTVSFCMAQDKFTITGNLPNVGNEKIVMLNYTNSEGKNAKDSAIVKAGKFMINGTTAYGNKSYLTIMDMKRDPKVRNLHPDTKDFYLEKGAYKIVGKDSIVNSTITGTQVQKDYLEYTAKTQAILAQWKDINERFAKVWYAKPKDTVLVKKLQEEAKPIFAKVESTMDAFIFSHPDSYVTLDLIFANKMMVIDVVKFDPYYAPLSQRVLASFTGKKITDKYMKAKQFAVGKSIDFTLPDKNGTEFKLSSLKGKYVLVDFWASWCVPCRAENPFLLKAYSELKDKNFTIVGVSLDDERANWLKAVEADKLPWTQVSDVKGFKTEVALRFGITAIPQNVLIDPDGKVIAKDLRGEDVNKKIASFIK